MPELIPILTLLIATIGCVIAFIGVVVKIVELKK